jgi:nucleoside-diphosphate-sugar epimerase
MPTPAWLTKLFLAIFDKLRLSPLYQWIYATADKDSFVSNEKIKKALNWLPKYSNQEALIRSYEWYLQNKQYLGKTGITHRDAWRQGALSLIKKFL